MAHILDIVIISNTIDVLLSSFDLCLSMPYAVIAGRKQKLMWFKFKPVLQAIETTIDCCQQCIVHACLIAVYIFS